MTQTIDLKALEKKAWRSVFQDGLWDIYLGLILISFAVSVGRGQVIPERRDADGRSQRRGGACDDRVLYAGKRFITMPRMGTVKFGAERQKRRNIVRLILFISVLVGLSMWFLSTSLFGEGRGVLAGKWVFPLVWVLNMLMVFGLGAYFLEYERLYVIGFLYAAVIPLDVIVKTFARVDIGVYIFLAAGAIILVMGIAYLVRFMRDYKPLNLPQG